MKVVIEGTCGRVHGGVCGSVFVREYSHGMLQSTPAHWYLPKKSEL